MIGPLIMFFACATTPTGSNPEISVADCKIMHKVTRPQQQENAESVNKPVHSPTTPNSESTESTVIQPTKDDSDETVSNPADGNATPDNNPAY